MFKFILTEEQAHDLTEWAGEAQAIGWCDVHGAIHAAAAHGEELYARYEDGRFDIVAGNSFCMLHNEPATMWLGRNGFGAVVR